MALGILSALLIVAVVAGFTAISRPRFLWLREGELESSSQRSHVTVPWDDILSGTLSFTGGGDMSLQLILRSQDTSETVHWRNRWMPGRNAVEVDFASLGVDLDLLVAVIGRLMADQEFRKLLVSSPDHIAPLLLDANAPWPDGLPGRNRPY